MRNLIAGIAVSVLLSTAGCTSEAVEETTEPEVQTLQSDLTTPAERGVSEIIKEDGIHVVHFWAPWCHNSKGELAAGLYRIIEENPNVTFTFVTVWNDEKSGREMLDAYDIPDYVNELTWGQRERSERKREFMGLPITWTPTTWIFHRNGQLAYAFNYGELREDLFRLIMENIETDWSH